MLPAPEIPFISVPVNLWAARLWSADDSLMALIGIGADSTYLYTTDTSEVLQSGPKCYIKGIHFSNLAGLLTNIAPM